ncbi:hypothetical protein M9Y22_13990, partial [Escherichia coli]|nr:hypothetical protein [Escherichia coli]
MNSEQIKIKKVALRKVSLTTGTDYFSRRELSISFCNQHVRPRATAHIMMTTVTRLKYAGERL